MNKIREARKRAGLSQNELAKAIGVTQGAVSHWEQGMNDPDTYQLLELSKLLNASMEELIGHEIQSRTMIPVLGVVRAGIPISAVEEVLGYEEITPHMAAQGEYFALKIKGDSMLPRIRNGDIVIVKIQDYAESNSVCVVFVGNEDATIKTIRWDSAGLWLIPNNPAYESKFYSKKDIESLPVQILGRVVELRAKL